MKKNVTTKTVPTDGPADPPDDVKRGRAELARDLAILVRRRLRRERQRAADAPRPDAAGAEPGRVA
jgi:hypothetical protein